LFIDLFIKFTHIRGEEEQRGKRKGKEKRIKRSSRRRKF
jgi:hypothetical protein